MSENNNLIPVIKNGNLVKGNTPQDGNFELVDEVNPLQANQKLIDAVKNGDLAAVTAALDAGWSPHYEAPKLVIDQHMSNVANDIVINQILMKGFNSDVIVGDIHGTAPLNESDMTMLVLHELGHMEAGNIARNRVNLKEIEEKTGITLQEALKGPEGQGMTESYKAAAKDIIDNLGLTFVEPSALREKFNSADKKDKNTPK